MNRGTLVLLLKSFSFSFSLGISIDRIGMVSIIKVKRVHKICEEIIENKISFKMVFIERNKYGSEI